LVEIAKAISQQATVLILDEPTAVLTQREADRLFEIIESFAAEGVSILYISHRLEEVKRLATRIRILRDGCLVATRRATELVPSEIVRLMVGRSLQDYFPPKKSAKNNQVVLEVRHLSVPGYVNDASFELKKGEILGFAGLVGAGRTELFEGLMGLRKISFGTISRDGGSQRDIRTIARRLLSCVPSICLRIAKEKGWLSRSMLRPTIRCLDWTGLVLGSLIIARNAILFGKQSTNLR
jgi:ribose transport system ATP-binding protein